VTGGACYLNQMPRDDRTAASNGSVIQIHAHDKAVRRDAPQWWCGCLAGYHCSSNCESTWAVKQCARDTASPTKAPTSAATADEEVAEKIDELQGRVDQLASKAINTSGDSDSDGMISAKSVFKDSDEEDDEEEKEDVVEKVETRRRRTAANDTVPEEQVTMDFTIDNVDYGKLSNTQKQQTAALVAKNLAATAGISVDKVEVLLSPGSIHVKASVMLPPSEEEMVNNVQQQLQEPSTVARMMDSLVEDLEADDGIQAAKTGDIGTSQISVEAPTAGKKKKISEKAEDEVKVTNETISRMTTCAVVVMGFSGLMVVFFVARANREADDGHEMSHAEVVAASLRRSSTVSGRTISHAGRSSTNSAEHESAA